MPLYRRFLGGVPEYLARHYWWAYLWSPGSWFFDHGWIINAILFGQYARLAEAASALLQAGKKARVLQLTAVYGSLTPRLLETLPQGMVLADVADQQLERVRGKCPEGCLRLCRMNAECLGYADNAFDRVLVFFLFHELPMEARSRVRGEIARILQPGGRLVVAEYAELPRHHWMFRFSLLRWLLCRMEPFLAGFWNEDHDREMERAMARYGKRLERLASRHFFGGFYRVVCYRLRRA